MGVRSGRSRLDTADLMDPPARHTKARRAEEASLDASLDASLESSNDISSTSDDEDACSTGTDLSLMSEAEVRPIMASSLRHPQQWLQHPVPVQWLPECARIGCCHRGPNGMH